MERELTSGGGGPLAYFLTFTTYGTRVHGDERGSVKWRGGAPGDVAIAANERLEGYQRSRRGDEPMMLAANARGAVDAAIREACEFKGWRLHALNVRTNHVHVVVTSGTAPEATMSAMKAWATRRLRAVLDIEAGRVWTRHGSTRYLWKERDLLDACTYVLDGQGRDITPRAPGSEPRA